MGNATNRWLDRLAAWDKARGGTGTDYSLAKLLETDTQLVSKYRRELAQMGEAPALKVAQMLEVHPMVVMAEIAAERSRDVRMQRAWMDAARHYAKKAAFAGAVILTAVSAPSLSEAASQLCILCKVPPAPKPAPRLPQLIPGRIRTLEHELRAA
jgi:hypothetical protein